MITFYLLALIPVVIGGILWIFREEIVLFEWLGASIIAFLLAGSFHLIAIHGMTDDVETWSGQITNARQFSRWKEYYEYAVYRTEYYDCSYTTTDSKGNSYRVSETCSRQVFDHWEPATRWHEEYHKAYSNIDTEYNINKPKFEYFCKVFNNFQTIKGRRTTYEHNSRMIAGDPNDYTTQNTTGFIEPVTKKVSFENRVKAAPSVFSFIKVPTNITVFPWPKNPDPWFSQRVIGIANQVIPTRKWDELNAVLGPTKLVNLIIIGYTNTDSSFAQYQEAQFVGGKKNDLVIVYGDNNKKPVWVKVFGWTESGEVKANIESYIVENGVSTNLLGFLKKEVAANYKLKDWHKFDYIKIEPETKYYYWFIGVMVVVQIGLFIFFAMNNLDKEESFSYDSFVYAIQNYCRFFKKEPSNRSKGENSLASSKGFRPLQKDYRPMRSRDGSRYL